jgi:hypothetical protein
MTSGPQASVTAKEKEENGSGRKGEWAVGRIQHRAERLPRGLYSFFSFSFFISFLFCFAILQKTSI